MTTPHYQQACEIIQKFRPNFKPHLGIILGSGLANVAEQMRDISVIPYVDLPGFPVSQVSGHCNRLILGYLADVPIVCFQGRAHYYEGIGDDTLKTIVRTLRLLGASILLVTNAAGSLHPDISAGRLMLIRDHINFLGHNPLIGENRNEFGDCFVSMQEAYDPILNKLVEQAAINLNIPLSSGTYLAVSGPSYETPAEIHVFRQMGADAVGMSTVPEVIIARQCGLRVVAISAITNLAAGLADEKISHEGTLHYGEIAAKEMSRLINVFLEKLKNE